MTDISVSDFVFSVELSNEHPVVGDDIYLSIKVKSVPSTSDTPTVTVAFQYYLDNQDNNIYNTLKSVTYNKNTFINSDFADIKAVSSGVAIPVVPSYVGRCIGCMVLVIVSDLEVVQESVTLTTAAVVDNTGYVPETVEVITADYDFSTLPLRIATTAPIIGEDFVVTTPPLQLANGYTPDDAAVEITLYTDILGMPTGKCSTALAQNQAVKVITPLKVLPLARGQLIAPYAIINKYPNMGNQLYRYDIDPTTVPVDEPDSLKSIEHICTGVTDEYSKAVAHLSTDQPIVGEEFTITTIPFVKGTSTSSIRVEYEIFLGDNTTSTVGIRQNLKFDSDDDMSTYPKLVTDSWSTTILDLWIGYTLSVSVKYFIDNIELQCPIIVTKPVLAERPPEPEPTPEESDSSSSSSELLPELPAPKTRCQLLNAAIMQQVIANKE